MHYAGLLCACGWWQVGHALCRFCLTCEVDVCDVAYRGLPRADLRRAGGYDELRVSGVDHEPRLAHAEAHSVELGGQR